MSGILKVEEQIIHPGKKRTCIDCRKDILRNLAITSDGSPHHFGCLKRDHAQPAYHCTSCGAELKRSEVSTCYLEGTLLRSCSFCGSTALETFQAYAGSVF